LGPDRPRQRCRFGRLDPQHVGLIDTLARLDRDEADVLLSTHLDCMSRSVTDFANVVERARKRGWRVVALDTDIDTTTPHGELVANILASVAQSDTYSIWAVC